MVGTVTAAPRDRCWLTRARRPGCCLTRARRPRTHEASYEHPLRYLAFRRPPPSLHLLRVFRRACDLAARPISVLLYRQHSAPHFRTRRHYRPLLQWPLCTEPAGRRDGRNTHRRVVALHHRTSALGLAPVAARALWFHRPLGQVRVSAAMVGSGAGAGGAAVGDVLTMETYGHSIPLRNLFCTYVRPHTIRSLIILIFKLY